MTSTHGSWRWNAGTMTCDKIKLNEYQIDQQILTDFRERSWVEAFVHAVFEKELL